VLIYRIIALSHYRIIALPHYRITALSHFQIFKFPLMTLTEKILTLHPEKGKTGRNILKSKYDITCSCLLGIFAEQPLISHRELTRLSKERLNGRLEGNAAWYMETVLLDLVARGIISREAGKPVHFRMVAGK
jgi:hypothetical protein